MSTAAPTSIRAGDSASWIATIAAFPAGDGWALAYRLIPRAGGSAHAIAASAEGDDYTVSLSVSATSLYAAGEYTLVGYVERGADETLERATVHTSTLTVLPNLTTTATLDGRTSAQQIVEAIDAWLSGRAGWAGEKSVGDRSIKDHPLPDLITLRDYYAQQARSDVAAQNLMQGIGLGGGSRIMVRM
jgi:hypothetical protein